MSASAELLELVERIKGRLADPVIQRSEPILDALNNAADDVNKAASGSWRGYQANVYYENISPPPAGVHFDQEWGLIRNSITSRRPGFGGWIEFTSQEISELVYEKAGNPDLTEITNFEKSLAASAKSYQAEASSIVSTYVADRPDAFLNRLLEEIEALSCLTAMEVIEVWSPKGQFMTRDTLVISQGMRAPPHLLIKAEVASIRRTIKVCEALVEKSVQCASHIARQEKRTVAQSRVGTNVFIGHGRSPLWREVKDFVRDRLRLPADEFNRVPVAGITNQARLIDMLDAAALAFVIMTAEDEQMDGKVQARMNVIHEVGLFQGRLGFTKAIVLLEEGCEEFSNIQGIGQIRFPKGKISACFEELRAVAEREGLIQPV